MNAYLAAALGLGVLVIVAVAIGRFIHDDVTEADVQRELDALDPGGWKRNR